MTSLLPSLKQKEVEDQNASFPYGSLACASFNKKSVKLLVQMCCMPLYSHFDPGMARLG